jgi:elongation factor G
VAKVDEIEFDCVLHDSHDEDHIHLKPLEFPQPMHGLAVTAVRKADEQRLFEILRKLEIEDPCFKIERHATTNETVIRGIGEMHLRAKLTRLAQQYKLELDTAPPQIAYREAITAAAEGHCRHKKQSGGAGQFGEVALRVEPLERGAGFEFVDVVKGGVIPGVFMASVEKGVRQALADGVIAGFAVQDLRVTVHDGKSHPVDGKDIAFQTAGRKATIEAIRAAKPIVLEPVVEIEILAPEAMTGDLTGDLSSKRGHLTGTQPRGPGVMAITGQVPLAELDGYQSRLKSLTAGQGSYSISFSHYAQVPPATQQQLVADHQGGRRGVVVSDAANRRQGAVTGAAKLADWFLPLARRLLYFWVRSSVFPAKAGVALDPMQAGLLRAAGPPLVEPPGARRRIAAGWPATRRGAARHRGGQRQARSFFFVNRDRSPAGRARRAE